MNSQTEYSTVDIEVSLDTFDRMVKLRIKHPASMKLWEDHKKTIDAESFNIDDAIMVLGQMTFNDIVLDAIIETMDTKLK